MERMIDFNTADRTITVPAPAVDLSAARQLEMFVHQRWAIAILRVKDMVIDGNSNAVVSFHDPESRLEFDHPVASACDWWRAWKFILLLCKCA